MRACIRTSRARAVTAALALALATTVVAAGTAPVLAAAAVATHVVKAGDTLIGIARRYGTTTSAIVAANGLKSPNVVIVGQRLAIPSASAAPPAVAAATGVHVVKAGETIDGISRRYGVSITAIAVANAITNPNLILIGQRLTIPSASAAPGAGGTTSTTAYAKTGGADGITTASGFHIVATNETLQSIARKYGVTVEDLAAANGNLPPHILWSSMRLDLTRANRLPDDIDRCPVPGAKYANDYGFPRPGGRTHAGNDLLAPRGTPVRAPVSGIVAYLTGPIGGNQFRLRGDDGNLYIGTHLDSYGKQGWVAAGDTIGYVGNSGNAVYSVPHLHFEVHPDRGPAMNPYPLLRTVCA